MTIPRFSVLLPARAAFSDGEQAAKPEEGHETAPDIEEGRSLARIFELRGQFDTFFHGGQREGVVFATHFDQQAVDDGEREGQAQGDGRAMARLGREVDLATKGLDRALDDIQPDTPAR